MLRTRSIAPVTLLGPTVPPVVLESFRDDFDGPTLDLTKWRLEELGYGYGSLEKFRADSDLATIVTEGGKTFLRLSAKKDVVGDARTWRSPFGTTRGIGGSQRFTMKTGTVEWRMRLPTQQGAWPALWLDNGAFGESTRWGEIDLMELFPGGGEKGSGPTLTLHDWYQNPSGSGVGASRLLNSTAHIDGLWHDYKVTWDAAGFKAWFDGSLCAVMTPAQFKAESNNQEGDYVQSFLGPDYYLIFDMAVGTTWGGPEPAAGVTRLDLDIDYIYATKTS